MHQLDWLQVRNFRGIRHLRLDIQGANLIIVGENGSGKSSIVDALEYGLTGKVEKLRGRSDVQEKEALPHLSGGKTSVEMGFHSVDEALYVPFPRRGKKVPDAVESLRHLARERPFILRRAQILTFINARPSKRYQELSKIFGLGELDDIDNAWRKGKRQAEKKVENSRREQKKIRSELGRLLSAPVTSDGELCRGVNEWLGDHGFEPVTERHDLQERHKELRERVSLSESTLIADRLKKSAEEIYQWLAKLEQDLLIQQSWREDADRLLRKSGEVEDGPWEQLLGEAYKQISKQADLEHCPLCASPIIRKELLHELEQRRQELHALITLRDKVEQGRRDLVNRLNLRSRDLTKLLKAVQEQNISTDEATVNAAQVAFGDWSHALNAERFSDVASPWITDERITQLRRMLTKTAAQAKREAKARAGTSEQETLITLLDKLTRVDEKWLDLEKIEHELARAEHVHQQITEFYEQLLAARQRGIERLRQALEADFERFYQLLHPDEGYEAIAIIPEPDKRSSIALTAQFYGGDPAHPLNHWSEGHLDSLGLCIFLAFIRHFGDAMRLIALDDVLTTVDAGHRLRVARLLAQEFDDYQLLLTTHDRLWAEQLNKVLPNSRLVRLKTWSLEEGTETLEYVPVWDYYREQAHNGRAQDAIAGTGRVLEKFLFEMRGRLGLAVPAKRYEDYTIGDLYTPFFMWVEKYQPVRPDRPSFYEDLHDLKERLEQVWRLRNWAGAHHNPWGETVTPIDALSFIDEIETLTQAFECPRCSELVVYNSSIGVLHCPNCRPSPPPLFVPKYKPARIQKALRSVQVDYERARKGAVIEARKALKRFLQDAKQLYNLYIPADITSQFVVATLLPVFKEWVEERQLPDGTTQQKENLGPLLEEIYPFMGKEGWLPVPDEERVRFVQATAAVVSLFHCAHEGHEHIYAYDKDKEQFICPIQAEVGASSEQQGALWYVKQHQD